MRCCRIGSRGTGSLVFGIQTLLKNGSIRLDVAIKRICSRDCRCLRRKSESPLDFGITSFSNARRSAERIGRQIQADETLKGSRRTDLWQYSDGLCHAAPRWINVSASKAAEA
jgi:hypothetical protein